MLHFKNGTLIPSSVFVALFTFYMSERKNYNLVSVCLTLDVNVKDGFVVQRRIHLNHFGVI